ncbi:MAG: hypothetical protein HY053_08630 [Proteobacteria bacterium]|nr:hypothetical protein [Pseudomonadota bacterium]
MPHLPPLLHILIADLLLIWPLMRLYRRVGLSPLWALLIFASVLVPISGLLLAALPLTLKKWPNFPDPEKPRQPVKTPI